MKIAWWSTGWRFGETKCDCRSGGLRHAFSTNLYESLLSAANFYESTYSDDLRIAGRRVIDPSLSKICPSDEKCGFCVVALAVG